MDIEKIVSALTIEDFSIGNIWTWADEDDNIVRRIDYQDSLSEEYNALFVGCEFTLNDGVIMRGVVFVRISDHKVYSIAIPTKDGDLIDFPLNPSLIDIQQEQSEKLVIALQRPLKDIFPLVFISPYVFSDSSQLKGSIYINNPLKSNY